MLPLGSCLFFRDSQGGYTLPEGVPMLPLGSCPGRCSRDSRSPAYASVGGLSALPGMVVPVLTQGEGWCLCFLGTGVASAPPRGKLSVLPRNEGCSLRSFWGGGAGSPPGECCL